MIIICMLCCCVSDASNFFKSVGKTLSEMTRRMSDYSLTSLLNTWVSCFPFSSKYNLWVMWSKVSVTEGVLNHSNTTLSVFIGILLQSTAWYTEVKQHWPRFVLGWVTVLVCQFLLIVLLMRL